MAKNIKVMSISFRYGMGCPGECLHGASVSICDLEDKDNSWQVIKIQDDLAEELQALILEKLSAAVK